MPDEKRPIIRELAEELKRCAQHLKSAPPIRFRNEDRDKIQRPLYRIPIDNLKYRKDNGRIASEILSYEKENGELEENSDKAQEIIEGFLLKKDEEQTKKLKNSLKADGQREPAIATCDGFLINGNRRKMALRQISKKNPEDDSFRYMNVVLLPDENEEGGPPTIKEIEQIENRYQLQQEGRAEYSKFDRALSVRRKIENGMDLVAQLRDDSTLKVLNEKEFKKEMIKFEKEYLKPLECIDQYLEYIGQAQNYHLIASGIGDSEGRWQAFVDYYEFEAILRDPNRKAQYGIEDGEEGKFRAAAFNMIRQRKLYNVGKLHQAIRDLKKWVKKEESKQEILELADIEPELPEEEIKGQGGSKFNDKEIENIWCQKYGQTVVNQVQKAKHLYEFKKEKEDTLSLMEAAHKKLIHEKFDPKTVPIDQFDDAMNMARLIKDRAQEIESEFYHLEKELRKMTSKKK